MPKILVFDTETTGLPSISILYTDSPKIKKEKMAIMKNLDSKKVIQSKKSWKKWGELWPNIIQLSYILYDTDTNKVLKIYNKYLELPGTVEHDLLSNENIVPIIKNALLKSSKSKMERVRVIRALHDFLTAFKHADIVVGHNVLFDKQMIIASMCKSYSDYKSDKHFMHEFSQIIKSDKFVCTQELTTPICKLPMLYSREKHIYKFPKLKEAHKYIFGYEPVENTLHNALYDAVITLRCFYWIFSQGLDICTKNSEIRDLILLVSPPKYKCGYVESFSMHSLQEKTKKNLYKKNAIKSIRKIRKTRKTRKINN